MPIARPPHPLFAGLWALWLVNVYAALALNEYPAYGLAVLVLHFAIEIPAAFLKLRGNARDTLSEISTWVQRKTSKHARFARGWNAALLAGLVLPVAFLLYRTVAHYADAPLLGVVMSTLCAVFLWDHFVSPEVHG